MFSVTVLITDKLTPCRDTLELSAEVRTLTVSIRRDTAPTQERRNNTGKNGSKSKKKTMKRRKWRSLLEVSWERE